MITDTGEQVMMTGDETGGGMGGKVRLAEGGIMYRVRSQGGRGREFMVGRVCKIGYRGSEGGY